MEVVGAWPETASTMVLNDQGIYTTARSHDGKNTNSNHSDIPSLPQIQSCTSLASSCSPPQVQLQLLSSPTQAPSTSLLSSNGRRPAQLTGSKSRKTSMQHSLTPTASAMPMPELPFDMPSTTLVHTQARSLSSLPLAAEPTALFC